MTTVGQRTAVTAAAFLDGAWEPAAMAARAAHDLGLHDAPTTAAGTGAWVLELARVIHEALPVRPLDAPRALQQRIRATGLLPSRPTAPARRTPALVETAMGAMPWPVLPLPDVAALEGALGLPATHLDWFADVRSLERAAADEALRHYRYRWVPKAAGGARLIEAPKDRLRAVQRLVLREVLDHIPPHPAACGFRPGGSVHRYVAPHVARDVVIAMDLEGFFAAVGPGRVYATYRAAGFPEPVAHLLTGLATNAVPAAVLAVRAHDRASWATRRDLAHPHLPQGAPTSPALANLAANALDRRLTGLSERFGAVYTRYADDLAFSGEESLRRTAGRFVARVRAVISDEGFRPNDAKTRVMPRWTRQRLGGLVVNTTTNVARAEVDRLRAVLHDARRNGAAAANLAGHDHFAAHLLGRIAWVAAANPVRGRRLLAAFDAVDWTAEST